MDHLDKAEGALRVMQRAATESGDDVARNSIATIRGFIAQAREELVELTVRARTHGEDLAEAHNEADELAVRVEELTDGKA